MFPWMWWADPETFRGRQGKYVLFALICAVVGMFVVGWLFRHLVIQLIISSVTRVLG